LGVEVAQWADEIDDLNETTSWRELLGEGIWSDGFPNQNEGERFLYTFWPWPAYRNSIARGSSMMSIVNSASHPAS
jgi:hypothetical protein